MAKSICWRVPFRYSVICRSASHIRGLGGEVASQQSVSAMCVMAPRSSVSRTMPIGLLKVYVAGVINRCYLCPIEQRINNWQSCNKPPSSATFFRVKRVLHQIFSAWCLYAQNGKSPDFAYCFNRKSPDCLYGVCYRTLFSLNKFADNLSFYNQITFVVIVWC